MSRAAAAMFAPLSTTHEQQGGRRASRRLPVGFAFRAWRRCATSNSERDAGNNQRRGRTTRSGSNSLQGDGDHDDEGDQDRPRARPR